MSNIITVPLQKSIPSLRSSSSQSEWGKILCDYLVEGQNDISGLIASFNRNLEILEHQKNQASLLVSILEECGGLTIRARNMLSTQADKEKYQKNISELEEWFKSTVIKYNNTIATSEYQGINLMNGGLLVTPLDKKGLTKMVTEGIDLTSSALGIRAPDFTNTFSAQNSRIDVMNAIDMVVTIHSIISSHISSLQIGLDIAGNSTKLSQWAQPALSKTDLTSETNALLHLTALGKDILGDEPMAEPSQRDVLNNFASSTSIEDI